MTRDTALALLHEYTQSDSLRRHAYAVEAAMRAYARKLEGDEEEWGIVGLLHDFDYERYPTEEGHPFEGNRILGERGYPENIRRAIMSHADHTGVARESPMEKALFAVDELCGFLTAVSYVRPDRSIAGLQVKSVKKKMKDKGFARAVSREDLLRGAEEVGIPFDEHVAFVIEALTEVRDRLGI
ncbi:MAG: HDIG domain-containing protein [Bacteroidetes bacterium]|nr:HDIG domain-containing protein [Bacteroidota bacterium]